MSRSWTLEQVTALAPDSGSLKAGQALATPRKWTLLGRGDPFLWGLAQGSGKNPYQVQVDLDEPAFKCSCPSRKFPCKHALGLMLLSAGGMTAITEGPRPEWAKEWTQKRAERSAKQEERAQAEEKPVDAAAQTKRREKRAAKVEQGISFLEGWLNDLVRQGAARAAAAGYGFWDEPARRLIDAQAPGLARQVRWLSSLAGGRIGWEERFAVVLGRLHMLLAAHRQRDSLDDDWQAEIDGLIGWTIDQDELKQNDGMVRQWFTAAQTLREDERLVMRTTFVFSPEGDVGKLLEFSHGAEARATPLVPGRWFEGELVYFPGIEQTRALLKGEPRPTVPAPLPMLESARELLERYAMRLSANPFATELPVLVRFTPRLVHDRWLLADHAGNTLPISDSCTICWELLACSGGEPLALCGLWDGFAFQPLSIIEQSGALVVAGQPS